MLKSTQSQWCGQQRVYDVVTDESSNQHTCSRRRLCLLVPSGNNVAQLPPVVNLRIADPPVLGWTALLGLMSSLWRSGELGAGEEPTWSGCT